MVSIKWHFETIGSEKNPSILFLHGFMGSTFDWYKIADDLSADFYSILIDLPFHGDTKIIDGSKIKSMQNISDEVIFLLNDLSIKKLIIAGYSMGGRLALCLAMTYPERFSHIILESVSPGLQTEREQAERKLQDEELAKKLKLVKLEKFLLEWYSQPIFGDIKHHPEFNNLLKRRLLNDPDKLANSLSIMGTGNQPSFWPDLNNNKIPMLLLVGENDLKFKNIAIEIENKCTVANINVIKQCGHNIHFEKPEEYVQIIRKFLIE